MNPLTQLGIEGQLLAIVIGISGLQPYEILDRDLTMLYSGKVSNDELTHLNEVNLHG
jgi:hypothetical protein